jgi:hypothetical protein
MKEGEKMPETPGSKGVPEPEQEQPSAAEQAEEEQRKQEQSGQENAA